MPDQTTYTPPPSGRSSLWIWGIVLVVLVLTIIFVPWQGCFNSSHQPASISNAQAEFEQYQNEKRHRAYADSVKKANELKDYVNKLTDRVSAQGDEIASLQKQVAVCCAAKKKAPVKRVVKRATAPVAVVQRAPAEVQVNRVVQAPPSTVTSRTVQLDQLYYESGSKTLLFCLRLGENNGRHFPHLGMLNGEVYPGSEPNNQSGYNFRVEPTALTDVPSGSYGCTKDGTFFVARDIVDKYLTADDNGVVEIKTTVTGWMPKKMSVTGGYYTFKR